jgi:hypothetical protein
MRLGRLLLQFQIIHSLFQELKMSIHHKSYRGRKKMDDRDKIMPRDIVVANPIGPDGSKKRRRRVRKKTVLIGKVAL